MTEIDVSFKRTVYAKFAALILTIFISGRLMLSDPNVVYRYIGTFAFVGFNMRAIMMAVYIQHRSRTGWETTIDIPDRD
jgi:hypothetical protein